MLSALLAQFSRCCPLYCVCRVVVSCCCVVLLCRVVVVVMVVLFSFVFRFSFFFSCKSSSCLWLLSLPSPGAMCKVQGASKLQVVEGPRRIGWN